MDFIFQIQKQITIEIILMEILNNETGDSPTEAGREKK